MAKVKDKLKVQIENTVIISLLLLINVAYSLHLISEKLNNDWYTISSICYITILFTIIRFTLKKWKEFKINNISSFVTNIMFLVNMFCPINIACFYFIPNAYSNINIANYTKDIMGALGITLDMYNYTIGNCLFGCSYITPNSTVIRLIASIQIIAYYSLIARGILNTYLDKLSDINEKLTLKLTQANIELMDSHKELMKTQSEMIDIHSNILREYKNKLDEQSKMLDIFIDNKTSNRDSKIGTDRNKIKF